MKGCQKVLMMLFVPALIWVGEKTGGVSAMPASEPTAQATGQAAGPAATQAVVTGGVIKKEANLVLVDAVVTDKKGRYVNDLTAKDFRVYQDGKEQPIASFSQATGQAGPHAPGQRHYMVLFFDDSTMEMADQMYARKAAGQFIQKTVSGDTQMAVADFGGTVRLLQDFTDNASVLQHAVSSVQYAAVSPNLAGQTTSIVETGIPSMEQLESDFGAETFLLAVRDVCNTLAKIPGRKTMILFSSGFPMTDERMSELTAAINAANQANVAIYTLDVRGLMAAPMGPPINAPGMSPVGPGPGASLQPLFPHSPQLFALLWDPFGQHGGAGGGGGGHAGGGGMGGGGMGGGSTGGGGHGGATGGGAHGGSGGHGSTGSTGGSGRSGGTSGRGGGGGGAVMTQPFNQSILQRPIIPALPPDVSINQSVLYALATGTGGFPIFNTNDFLSGLERVANEMRQYYILGYVPPSAPHDGEFHKIRVTVEQRDLEVRARSGFFAGKSEDILAGQPEGKTLEALALATQPGGITASMEAPYFYTAQNTARVNLAVAIPTKSLNFEKDHGKYQTSVTVLGMAMAPDNSVAARFSDKIDLKYDKKELKQMMKGNYEYQNIFDIAPGHYTLRVVLSDGANNYAKCDAPLVIPPHNGRQFGMSGLALSANFQPVSELGSSLDQALMADHTPLIIEGDEIIPSGSDHFNKSDRVGLYVEVYEPLMQTGMPPRVGVDYEIIDQKTNQSVYNSNTILINEFAKKGSPVIPVALKVPTGQLHAGEYKLEMRARDEMGNASSVGTATFQLD
ncbi:MAG: VWA domain-containing protein [Terriglobia bacterium]